MTGQTGKTKEKKEIVPVTPTSFADVEDVVRKLKRKEGVIVDLEDVPATLSQRILDFLCGAVFSLGGSVKRLKYKLYILIPNGVKISSVRGK